MKPLKEKVSITLDGNIVERIKELAENDDRSFSQYINMVLKEWVNKVDDKQGVLCWDALFFWLWGFLELDKKIFFAKG